MGYYAERRRRATEKEIVAEDVIIPPGTHHCSTTILSEGNMTIGPISYCVVSVSLAIVDLFSLTL